MSTETAAEQEARFILDEKEAAGPSKDERILDACRLRDLELLKDLAEQEGGFLNDDLRRLACEFSPSSWPCSHAPLAASFPFSSPRHCVLRDALSRRVLLAQGHSPGS